jgi:transposase
MGSPVPLRGDFDAAAVRMLARQTQDSNQSRRLLALAAIYDGGLRGDAARIGSVGLQTVRDWVLRFNGTGPDGLVDGKAPGQTPRLNKAQRQALVGIVESGPIPAVHGIVRWRLIDLAQWVWDEFGVSVSEATMSRELKVLGFSKLSARPRHHAQNELAIADFKKKDFRPSWRRSEPGSRQGRI